ncbi:MAG TPA: hypothetical protein PKG77_10130 [Phycisphaerae bacterium]|nr:hypothetical protein [Phycisphaerae bacterium]HQL75307.1 hypothetical protein [Phycisphaerae bacterium]
MLASSSVYSDIVSASIGCMYFWWVWIGVLVVLPGVLRKPSSSIAYRRRDALVRRVSAFLFGCLSAAFVSLMTGSVSAYGLYLARRSEWGGYGLLALVNAAGLAASSTAALVILRRPILTLAGLITGFVLPLTVGAPFLIPLDMHCLTRLRDRLAADRARQVGAARAARATQPSATSAPGQPPASQAAENPAG